MKVLSQRLISLGGEARLRFEAYENEFFKTNPGADHACLSLRYLLHRQTFGTRFSGRLGHWDFNHGTLWVIYKF